ncbi:MAG: nicotinamide mononucleotide transporter [Pseudomonadota bacterium]|nr:nicotinamide mononucleotide transporter [Pseudomonadota bacterium]MEC7702347.1 nicotinamide mononucleotide transporter [Pseudomonadota bacterium]MEC9235665.1 nicotinamide mononucleotide transporter [Pseudomonadota bacterium]MED5424137.1 nicotinamide mononucleotide transporter [Pseudomonadota bacterium]
MDWLAFLMGCTGAWLTSCKRSYGFVIASVGCICGLLIALMSGQYGFVVSNFTFILINVNGFIRWQRDDKLQMQSEAYTNYSHIQAEAAE